LPESENPAEGDSREAFSNFLREMQADRKAENFEEMAERLVNERRIRRFLETFKKKGFMVQENLDESIGFDFLLRKFDREILVTLKYQRNEFSLSKDALIHLHKILRSNSLSEGVVIVWISSSEHSSVYLSIFRLNRLLMEDRERFSFVNEIQSLDKCISRIFMKPSSFVSELKPRVKARALTEDRIIASHDFNETILRLFGTLKNRKYRLKHKKEALESFSRRDLVELQGIFELASEGKFEKRILDDALQRIASRSS